MANTQTVIIKKLKKKKNIKYIIGYLYLLDPLYFSFTLIS